MRYHLWLNPSGDLFGSLKGLMVRLCQEYRGPEFDPHITLLGDIDGDEEECCEKVNGLAHSLRTMEIRCKELAYQEDYFHCLYITVENTPVLANARQEATRIFGQASRSPFHPHVSLLYGLFPSRVKKSIIKSFPGDWPRSGLAKEMTLVRAESTNPKDWHAVRICRLAE